MVAAGIGPPCDGGATLFGLFALDCDYRNAPNNKYNDWKHTRDSDHGWHS
jgi:hypothetical protein